MQNRDPCDPDSVRTGLIAKCWHLLQAVILDMLSKLSLESLLKVLSNMRLWPLSSIAGLRTRRSDRIHDTLKREMPYRSSLIAQRSRPYMEDI